MNFININSILKSQKGIFTFLALFSIELGWSQGIISSNNVSNESFVGAVSRKSIKRGNIGFELTLSILPKAKIKSYEGSYKLKSHLQSSYDIGLNYLYNVKRGVTISTGLHFVVGKANFFLDVPTQDLIRYNILDGRKIIESKELWGAFRIPLVIEKKINIKRKNQTLLRAGLNLRYSGLMTDLVISGGGILDSNNQVISLFSGFFAGKNNYKPWISFLVGAGKVFSLKNKNDISICLQADISGTFFYTGTYEITIPNQPITSGTYKVNGTSLGLSVQYIFTGYNKQLLRSYQKKAF